MLASPASAAVLPLLLSAQQALRPQVCRKAAKHFRKEPRLLQRGDLAAARAAFAKAIQENPRNAKAANALGLVMLAQNDAASAIPQFQTALRVQPSFVKHASTSARPVANARCSGAP